MPVSEARLDLRIKPDIKEILSTAANMAGTSLSAFVISSTLEKAKQIIEDQDIVRLSNQDRDAFLKALDTHPQPNSSLQRAAQNYFDKGFS